jgi:hypothetical protein
VDADAFWTLIDRSRSALDLANPEAAVEDQLDALQTALRTHADRDLLLFQERLHEQTARANDWRIWAAGYLAAGGMSDDAFDYFRLWLVLQGRTAFERVLTEPDELADLRWDGGGAAFDAAEVAGYLVAELLEERGSDPGDALVAASAAGEPSGDPFDEEDDDWFAATFPRLLARVDAHAEHVTRTADLDVPAVPRRIAPVRPTEGPLPVRPMAPSLAAQLYELGSIRHQDRPMLAAYWLADDRGGDAVLELASLHGHEPEVSDLWPRALGELGVTLPPTDRRVAMAWAAQRVLAGERTARWLVQFLWISGDEMDRDPDFASLVHSIDDVLDWTDRDLRSRRVDVHARAATARAAVQAAVAAMAQDDLPGALRALDLGTAG